MQVRISARAAEGQDWHFQQGYYMALVYLILWNWSFIFPFSKMYSGNKINTHFLWGNSKSFESPSEKRVFQDFGVKALSQ